MNHLFLLFPKTIIDWLFTIAGIGFVGLFYFRKPRSKNTGKNLPISSFWRFLFMILLPLTGIVIELTVFRNRTFQSTAYDSSILIRLAAVGFPIVFSANYYSYRKGLQWVIGWGMIYSLAVTHSPFTILEFSILYVFIFLGYQECSRVDIHGFVVRCIKLLLGVTPFLFLISFIQYPGRLAVRLDAALTIGWLRVLGYIISTIFASLVVCGLVNLVFRQSEKFPGIANNGKSISDHLSQEAIVFFVVVLYLALSSGIWIFQRNSIIDKFDEATDEIVNSFATDYYSFLDMGKALIQSYAEEYTELPQYQYTTRVIEQINRIPFFSSMVVYEKGIIEASYPTMDNELSLGSDYCLGVTKTDTLLRTQKNETNSYFVFSSGHDEGVCVVGTTTLEFSPQLNQYVQLMNQFSTYWSMTDQSGAQFSFGEKGWEGESDFYSSGFYKEFFFTDDPLSLRFVQVYDLESIAKLVTRQTVIIQSALLFLHFVLMAGLLIFNRSMHQKIRETMRDLTYLKNFEFDALIKDNPENTWIGLTHQLRDIAIAIQSETSYLQKGLDIVDKINDVSNYKDLQQIITHEKFLQDIGKMTLLIDPGVDIVGFSYPDGQYLAQYQQFARKAEKESFQPIVIRPGKNRSGTEAPVTTLFPLQHEGKLVGFLTVLQYGKQKIQNYQKRFLQSLSNMIAGTVFHRIQRTKDSIEVERINFLVQSFPEPIIVLDRKQNLVVINDAAKKLPGVAEEFAVNGQPVRRFIRDMTLFDVVNSFDKNRNVGTRVQLSNRHEYQVTMVTGDDDFASDEGWILVALQDITQYKEQGQVRAELFETVAQYLQMPIKMTRGNLRMLSMVGSLNDSQRSYANSMEANIDDIDTFVRQMMDRNRLENPANYNIQIVNLDDILKEAVDRIVPYTKQQNVAIYLERAGDLQSRQIEIDPQLFSQAIFSLLENAVQNNHVGGEVEITIENHPDHFIVCIADNGPGISAVDLNRIFVDPSVLELHGDSPRISMGVQLAKSIIERHDGEIWVKSKLGKGSQFFVKIPRLLPSK